MTHGPRRMVGSETLYGSGSSVHNGSLLDFWQWAFSDLAANNLRGVYAEWLVAKLLQIDPAV